MISDPYPHYPLTLSLAQPTQNPEEATRGGKLGKSDEWSGTMPAAGLARGGNWPSPDPVFSCPQPWGCAGLVTLASYCLPAQMRALEIASSIRPSAALSGPPSPLSPLTVNTPQMGPNSL